MPSLADTQYLLWRLITAPEGVAAALAAADGGRPELGAALAATVRGTTGLDAVRRLDVYANMYFFRLLDVLKEDYPATRDLLGDVPFHNLVTDYLLHSPPSHFSVREAGRGLPELLDGHGARALHPSVADLASFERALNDAFDAADAATLAIADLAALPPDRWAELRLRLHPSVRLLVSAWPVHEVRAAVDRGQPAFDPERRATQLCVWRQNLTVMQCEVSALDLAALDVVRAGASFADVCATTADLTGESGAAEQVAAALARWVANGWFTPLGVEL